MTDLSFQPASLRKSPSDAPCSCGICQRIELTRQGKNPFFVRELETGYVVIGDFQRFPGYSLFLYKEHATELYAPAFRPSPEELERMKKRLNEELEKLLQA